METTIRDESGGPFHKIRSSFNEIFGKSETAVGKVAVLTKTEDSEPHSNIKNPEL
jgi:hypothetical protein